jgi:hypothetical protein
MGCKVLEMPFEVLECCSRLCCTVGVELRCSCSILAAAPEALLTEHYQAQGGMEAAWQHSCFLALSQCCCLSYRVAVFNCSCLPMY